MLVQSADFHRNNCVDGDIRSAVWDELKDDIFAIVFLEIRECHFFVTVQDNSPQRKLVLSKKPAHRLVFFMMMGWVKVCL
jgi:hypothetical protein